MVPPGILGLKPFTCVQAGFGWETKVEGEVVSEMLADAREIFHDGDVVLDQFIVRAVRIIHSSLLDYEVRSRLARTSENGPARRR